METGVGARAERAGGWGGLDISVHWLWSTPLRLALTITVIWRVMIAVWGALAHFFMPTGALGSTSLIAEQHWPVTPLNLVLDSGVRLDAGWYAQIVSHGYSFDPHRGSSVAFYPLYPMLIKIVSLVVGNVYAAGMVVSTTFLFLSIVVLHLWLKARGLETRGPVTVVVLLAFPWAFFYAAMYAESLYLFLAISSFLLFERQRWGLAAIATFFLVLTRPTGAIVLPCLILLMRTARVTGWRPWLPVGSGIAAIASFCAYQYLMFGSAVASMRTEALPPFSRTLAIGLSDLLLRPRHERPFFFLAAMLGVALLMLALVPLVYRRLGPAYALFAALVVLVPMATGLDSIERYVIVDFPVFVAVASTVWRRALFGYVTFCLYFLLFFTAAFVADWGVF